MFKQYSLLSVHSYHDREFHVLQVFFSFVFKLNKVGHKNHWYLVCLMNASWTVWQHPTSSSFTSDKYWDVSTDSWLLNTIFCLIWWRLILIVSGPAGLWERDELSRYLETQILKKLEPCAMLGAMKLSQHLFWWPPHTIVNHQIFKTCII